jgi:hypothetical protein
LSAENASDPVTIVVTRAEAGMIRVVLGTHRKTLVRKQRQAERKSAELGPAWLEQVSAHNERDSALTNSAYRKVKRAMWGKDDA